MIPGSAAVYTVVESDFLISKPPQSNKDGMGGSLVGCSSNICQSFSGWFSNKFYYSRNKSGGGKFGRFGKGKSLSVGVQLLSDLGCGPTWAKSVIFGVF